MMRRRIIGSICTALLIGCAGASGPDGPSGDPYVRGPIESIDHRATASGITVRAAPGSREACGIAATVDSETRYYRRSVVGELSPAAITDLGIGDTVEVYVQGPVAESCPVQAYASTLVLLGR